MKRRLGIVRATGATALIIQVTLIPLTAIQADPISPTAAGVWRQVDESGKVGALVTITREGDAFVGRLSQLFLNPETGKIYNAKMSLSPDGKRLTVRGFIGLSIFGRSQTWTRVE